MRQRHVIDGRTAVIVFETLNPAPRDASERYSYYVEYRDRAGEPRESEAQTGFIGPDSCIQDALKNLDALDMTPEEKPPPRPPRITVPYHHHICKVGCPIHSCVNPNCMSKGEFPRRVANVTCPNCGDTTGSTEEMWLKVTEFMPLVIERANAA
jgi:hypothetical protein